MTTMLLWCWLLGPAAILAAGAAAGGATTERIRGATALVRGAAAFNVLLALAAGTWTAFAGEFRTSLLGADGIGLSLTLDHLSGFVFALVSFIGWVVVGFSRNYLDGDANQGRFFAWMAGTLAAVLFIVSSGNLLGLTLAWIATSTCLHPLLRFYPDRPAATLAARKKFIVSRLGDCCLIAAMIVLWRSVGTLEIADLRKALLAHDTALLAAAPTSAVLVAAAALLKSAPFPLHGWIAEVMEAPTPVSAFLHAGVINAGGYLVLRHADLVASQPAALHLLALIGGITALFGSVTVLPQTSIKGALAHSTIAQMGFMMFECGLGAFSAATLHLVAHALYKAYAFLDAGNAVVQVRARLPRVSEDGRHPVRTLLAVAIAPVLALGIGHAFGIDPGDAPGVIALAVILLFGLIVLIARAIDDAQSIRVVLVSVPIACAVAVVYFALHAGMAMAMRDSLPTTTPLHGTIELLFIATLLIFFGVITVFQCLLPYAQDRPFWRALHAHLAAGLYINTFVNRWVLAIWPTTRTLAKKTQPPSFGAVA